LRKVSLPLALINNKNNLSKVGLIRDLKLASNVVFPVSFIEICKMKSINYLKRLDVLSTVRDMAKEQNSKDKDLNYVNWSMEKYYEYILSNLTPYLFPYS